MFGHTTYEKVRMPYAGFAKPGVSLKRETITAIDPANRRVTTNAGTHEADYLVVALGADYDFDATPGLREANEFYTFEGAAKLRGVLADFKGGHAVIGVCATPYKCPPAPSEAALMLHDFLEERGLRERSTISFVTPFKIPVPPSPETSKALIDAFAERDIAFLPDEARRVVDAAGKSIALDDGSTLPCDLFLGVPKHRVLQMVIDSGMSEVRLDPGRAAHAEDEISGRLYGGRWRQYRHAEGRRVRRRRGARSGRGDHRQDQRRGRRQPP